MNVAHIGCIYIYLLSWNLWEKRGERRRNCWKVVMEMDGKSQIVGKDGIDVGMLCAKQS